MAAIRKKSSSLSRISAEEALYDYAQSLKRHCRGRRGVVVNISRLTRYSREARHIRSAVEAFDPLMSRFPGQLFKLANDDLVCVVDGAGFSDIDEVIIRIRYLFRDDENLKRAEDDNGEDILCRWFNIGEEYEEFLEYSRSRFKSDEQSSGKAAPVSQSRAGDESPAEIVTAGPHQDPESSSVYQVATPTVTGQDAPGESHEKGRGDNPDKTNDSIERQHKAAMVKRPLQPLDLAKVESAIETMDVEGLIQRQEICLISPESEIRPIIVEHAIPIRAIERHLLPESDLASNIWLIRHLRDVLDRRLLRAIDMIPANSVTAAGLRVTIDAIFSDDFERFCANAAIAKQQRVVLEFSALDVLANPHEFSVAREKIAGWNFRICIGDMEPAGFMMLDRDRIAADFEKIRFDRSLLDDATSGIDDDMRLAVEQAGSHRIILCACECEEAIRLGMQQGFKLFQGSVVDEWLKTGPIEAIASPESAAASGGAS